MNREAGVRPAYVSPRGLARLAGGLLGVSSALAWVAVGYDLAEIRFLSRIAAPATAADERASFAFTGAAVTWAQLALLVVTAVFFVLWLYQARANVRAFGARRLSFPSRWAVLGFLVPVANLVVPYRVAREVWQASDPRAREPLDWMRLRPSPLLPVWWGTFVTFACLELAGLFLSQSAGYDPARLQLARGVQLAADAAAAVAAALGYFVVARISDAQDERWEMLRTAGSP